MVQYFESNDQKFINYIMCLRLKQKHLSRSPADFQQICEDLRKRWWNAFRATLQKKQRIEFLDWYDDAERKRGL